MSAEASVSGPRPDLRLFPAALSAWAVAALLPVLDPPALQGAIFCGAILAGMLLTALAAVVLLARRAGRKAPARAAGAALAHLVLVGLAAGAVLIGGAGSAGVERQALLAEAARQERTVRAVIAVDPGEIRWRPDYGGYATAPATLLNLEGSARPGPSRIPVTLTWSAPEEAMTARAAGLDPAADADAQDVSGPASGAPDSAAEHDAAGSARFRTFRVLVLPQEGTDGRVLRLAARAQPADARTGIGQEVAGTGRADAGHSAGDSAGHSAGHDAGHSAVEGTPDGQLTLLTKGHAALAPLRESFSATAVRLFEPTRSALVQGMTYGEDDALPEEVAEAMKVSGLTHLTAVSGSNVSVVFLLGLAPWRWLRAPRLVGFAAGLACVAGYVLLVGPEPSILRAGCMGAIGAAAVALGRPGGAAAALWVSVIVLMCLEPLMAREPGFILSALATAGIVLQGRTLRSLLIGRMPAFPAEVLAMTLVATLWCAPYLVAMTGTIGTYTVLANLLVAPVVPVITVLGVIGLAGILLPPVGWAAIGAAGLLTGWVRTVGLWCAGLPGARLEAASTPWGPALVLVAALLGVGWLAWLGARRRTGPLSPGDNLLQSLLRQDPGGVGNPRAP